MNTSHPPHLATWLLETLASPEKRDSLIGDLNEQYRKGRSDFWYWRQALTAVMVGAVRDVRAHGGPSLWVVVFSGAISMAWMILANVLYGSAGSWANTWTRDSAILGAIWWLYRVPLLMLWCIGSAAIGWAIARTQRNHRAGMLFLSAAFQPPLMAAVWVWPIWRLADSGLPFFRSLPVLFNVTVILVLMPISLLVGGLSACRASDERPLQTKKPAASS